MIHSVALNTTNKTLLTRKASSVPHTILAPVPCGRGNIYSSVYVDGMSLLSCHVTHSCNLPLNTTQTSPPYSTFVHTLASLSSSPHTSSLLLPHTTSLPPPHSHTSFLSLCHLLHTSSFPHHPHTPSSPLPTTITLPHFPRHSHTPSSPIPSHPSTHGIHNDCAESPPLHHCGDGETDHVQTKDDAQSKKELPVLQGLVRKEGTQTTQAKARGP